MWSLSKTYEDSLRLLKETDAVVEMHKYGAMMDLVGIDAVLVSSIRPIGTIIYASISGFQMNF